MAKDLITEIIDPKVFAEIQKTTAELLKMKETLDMSLSSVIRFKTDGVKSLNDYDKSVIKANNEWAKYARSVANVQAASARLATQMDRSQKAQEKQTREQERANNAYYQQSDNLKKLSDRYRDLYLRGEAGSEAAKKLRAEIDSLNKSIKEADAAVGAHQRNVGNYTSVWGGLKDMLLSTAIGYGTIGAAMKAVNFIVEQSVSLTKGAAQGMEALKWAAKGLAIELLKGNTANIAPGGASIGATISKYAAAGAATKALMQDLSKMTRETKVDIDKLNTAIGEQMLILRDRRPEEQGGASLNERLAANAKIDNLNESILEKETKLAENKLKIMVSIADFAMDVDGKMKLSNDQIIGLATNSKATIAQLKENFKDTPELLKNLDYFTAEMKNNIADALADIETAQQRYLELQLKKRRTEGQIAKEIQSNIEEESKSKVKSLKDESEAVKQATEDYIKYNKAIRDGSFIGPLTLNELGIQGKSFQDSQTSKFGGLHGAKPITSADILAESTEKAGEAMIHWRGLDLKNFKDNEKEKTEIAKEEIKKRLQAEQASFEIAQKSIDVVNSLNTIRYNNFKSELDDEYAALEDQHDKKLITDLKYQQEKDKLDKRARQIEREKAEKDKQVAIFEAIINTAQGVTQALAAYPPPLSYILAAITSAMGAAQIGVITSEPLPKYAKGRKGGREEYAIVGEAGPEVVTRPGKSPELVTSETITHLEAGASVIPVKDIERMGASFAFSPVVNSRGEMGYDIGQIIKDTSRNTAEAIVKAIREKDSTASVNLSGIYDGMRWSDYVNNNFRK